jgi:hypothetical protein
LKSFNKNLISGELAEAIELEPDEQTDGNNRHVNLCKQFIGMSIRNNVGRNAAAAQWDFMLDSVEDVTKVLQESTLGMSYKSAERYVGEVGPRIKVFCIHRDRLTNNIEEFTGPAFPTKKYQTEPWIKELEIYSTTLAEVCKLHKRIHADNDKTCQTERIRMSCDGVPESRGGSVDITSISFLDCRNVYNVLVVKKR